MKVTVIVTLLFAIYTTASARIGETYDELVKRYGQPLVAKPDQPARALPRNVDLKRFHFQRWEIEVHLLNGRSAYESYAQPRPTGNNTIRGEMYQSDIDLILGANSRGKEWKTVETVDYAGKKRKLGSYQDPYNLINAWVLEGEPLTCIHERFISSDGTHVDEIRIFAKEWNDLVAGVSQKEREKEIKKSGL